MQNPVIQRIKRRAEYRQSLPVTCGHRGNDTGNGLVTVVSLRSAVICFLENGKSPHFKPFTFLLLPAAKCRSGMFFTLRQALVCNLGLPGQRRQSGKCGQDAGPLQHQDDATLCPGSRQLHSPGHDAGGESHLQTGIAECALLNSQNSPGISISGLFNVMAIPTG